MEGVQREMTLDEYLAKLLPHHAARRELDALRAEVAALKAKYTKLQDNHDKTGKAYFALCDEVTALKAERDEARDQRDEWERRCCLLREIEDERDEALAVLGYKNDESRQEWLKAQKTLRDRLEVGDAAEARMAALTEALERVDRANAIPTNTSLHAVIQDLLRPQAEGASHRLSRVSEAKPAASALAEDAPPVEPTVIEYVDGGPGVPPLIIKTIPAPPVEEEP